MHINTYYVNKEEQSRIVFILEYIIKRKFHTNVAARAELHSPDIIKPGNSFCLLTTGQCLGLWTKARSLPMFTSS